MKTFEIGETVRPIGDGCAIVIDYDEDTGQYLLVSISKPNEGFGWEDWFSPFELEKVSD